MHHYTGLIQDPSFQGLPRAHAGTVVLLQKTIPDQSTEPNRQAQARTPKEAEIRTNHRTTQRRNNTGADT
jgi:hypothetical protein